LSWHTSCQRALSVRETEQLAGRAEATVRKTRANTGRIAHFRPGEKPCGDARRAGDHHPGKHGRGKLVIGYSVSINSKNSSANCAAERQRTAAKPDRR